MKKYSKLLVFAICFATGNSTFSQTDSIDLFVQSQMMKRKIPGLQLAVVQNGRIVKQGNYGYANLQDSIVVSDKSVFPINSITKAFTGVAIMQLVEAGKLSLSTPISKYLTLPSAWKGITIQQLLSHTSGIPDIVDEEESTLISPRGEAESYKQVEKMQMLFTPGERFQYNQTNYLLLGQIIDTVSKMPFQEFIVKNQLQKASMLKTMSAGFGATKNVIPHSAGGYRWVRGNHINMFFSFPSSLQTAAGMSSTAYELGRWIIALQTKKLLTDEASLAALWNPAKLNNGKTGGFNSLLNGYAAGWPTIGREEHPAVAPVGGGRSAVFVYPKDDLSIVVLTNLSGGSPEGFIDEIAGFYIADMKESNGFGLSASMKALRDELEKTKYQNAAASLQKLKKSGKVVTVSESELNSWGYKLINQNKVREAVEVFKLNTSLYPSSANVFDSLGDAYALLGYKQLAIKNYEQSLALNPENKNAIEQIRRLK